MLTTKIDDPEHFQFASVVLKDSKTGITANRRLLVIKGGHLYYYSNVPKFFNGDPKSLQYHHQLPKSSINLVNIKKLKAFDSTSSAFQIIFDEMFMMEREDIRKTLIQNYSFTPKNKKDQIAWRFTCQNAAIKQKWVYYLSELKEYFIKEKEEIEKYFWNINEKQELNNSMSNNKRAKTPWRESTVQRKQYSGFDTKSMGDIIIPDFQMLDNSKTSKQSRMSSFYKPQVNMQKYEAEYQHLYKTQNLKQLNMKKVKTMQIQSFKDI